MDKDSVSRAKTAFDKFVAGSYYSLEMIYHLSKNPTALASLEKVIEELYASKILSSAFEEDSNV